MRPKQIDRLALHGDRLADVLLRVARYILDVRVRRLIGWGRILLVLLVLWILVLPPPRRLLPRCWQRHHHGRGEDHGGPDSGDRSHVLWHDMVPLHDYMHLTNPSCSCPHTGRPLDRRATRVPARKFFG